MMKKEEAPASPRGAAIYYWGGDWRDEEKYNDDDDDDDGKRVSHRWNWNETKDDEASYADLYHSTFQERTSSRQRCAHTAEKFQLTLQDEGDADHWLFGCPPLFVTDLSTTPCEEEKEAPIPEELTGVVEADIKDAFFADAPDFVEEDGDFDAIPVVDLSLPKHIYAIQIRDACRNVGFFYIVNHGVDRRVMEGVLDKSEKFFELDIESKLEVSNESSTLERTGVNGGKDDLEGGEMRKTKGYRGYFGIGGEDLENKDGTRDLVSEEGSLSSSSSSSSKRTDGVVDSSRKQRVAGDFKEGFDCGLECDDDDDARVAFFGQNLWPDERGNPSIHGFRTTLMEYQSELIDLSDKLLLALGESLDNENPNGGEDVVVREDFFVRRSRDPMCTLRLLHYPPSQGSNDNDDGTTDGGASRGCGAHTDYGLFTILQQDSIGGLQVRNRNSRWIDAKPLKGSFVINVGDMLSHWTNGEYASTVHRVISPSVSTMHRYSVPFFFNPDHDALVKPLKGVGLDQGEGSDDGGRKALDILMARYDGTFQKSK